MPYNYQLAQQKQYRILFDNQEALNHLRPGIQIVGLREDYKRKRAWAAVVTENGELMTGYYGWSQYKPEKDERPAHYVFKAIIKVHELYRGQSGFQIGLMTTDGYEIETGATGTLEIMKRLAKGELKGNQDGEIELTFVIEKKGENVYVEPYFGKVETI